MQDRYAFATFFGISDAVAHRAGRLLEFEIGRERDGAAVSVRTMLIRLGQDPDDLARWLMLVDPLVAVGRLTRLISRFLIDGEPAADPAAVARNALAYAGRVVTQAQMHPEIGFILKTLARLRFWRR